MIEVIYFFTQPLNLVPEPSAAHCDPCSELPGNTFSQFQNDLDAAVDCEMEVLRYSSYEVKLRAM